MSAGPARAPTPWTLEHEIPYLFATLRAVRAHCEITFKVENGQAVEVDVPSLRMRNRDQIESWKHGLISMTEERAPPDGD